jgi:TetR/AcrR family transcriptional regulator
MDEIAPAPAPSPTDDSASRASASRKRTRIQAENEERILDAGLDVFSTYGFRGATVDQIAARAQMSKPNLLYYFRRKQDIYTAVLTRTLEMWLAPLGAMDPDGDPSEEIAAYIRAKLEQARDRPQESRLFAGELIQGAPMLRPVLETDLKAIVDTKAAVMRGWIAAGRLRPVDPVHLVFMIWATTQTYADFDVQVEAVLGRGIADPAVFQTAVETVTGIILRGILPDR